MFGGNSAKELIYCGEKFQVERCGYTVKQRITKLRTTQCQLSKMHSVIHLQLLFSVCYGTAQLKFDTFFDYSQIFTDYIQVLGH